jgi:hypothetical protein
MKYLKTLLALAAVVTLTACGTEDKANTFDEEPPAVEGNTDDMPKEPGAMNAGNPMVGAEVTIPPRPDIGPQIDRVGRAAINTALNNTFNGDDDAKGAAKDRYNAAGPTQWSEFTGDFRASLAILDSLDTVCGNQLLAASEDDTRYQTLATVLVDDQLYVNINSGQCGTYLGLEAEVVGAVPAGGGGCGGRTPSDDVIERSYSVLAAGALGGIDDTIQGDDGLQTADFPFLAPPSAMN